MLNKYNQIHFKIVFLKIHYKYLGHGGPGQGALFTIAANRVISRYVYLRKVIVDSYVTV